jgi:hypothetical protein
LPAHSCGKRRTDDAADACSGYGRWPDSFFLKRLDYTDMCQSTYGATTEGQPDALVPK